MTELQFTSSLSMGEIERNFKDIDLFHDIMEGLQEAIAYARGEAKPGTLVVERSTDSEK